MTNADWLWDKIPDRPDYYDRSGNPLTMRQWSRLNEDRDYYVVAQTQINDILVSTIWLGLNHNWWGGPPLIFETMVFDVGPKTNHRRDDLEQTRYSLEADAIRGHRQMVEMVQVMEGIELPSAP